MELEIIMDDSDFEFSSGTNKRYKRGRERVPKWTRTEKETLRNICQQYAIIIDNRSTENTMCSSKNRAWVDITQKMVQLGYFRDVARVREAYARMKKHDKQLERMKARKAQVERKDLQTSKETNFVSNDDIKCNHSGDVVKDGQKRNNGKEVTYGTRRSASWTQAESEMMKQLCMPHVDVLLDMRCTADVVQQKNTIWKCISRQMNRAGYQRDVCMIKCHWRHCKKIILLGKPEQLSSVADMAQKGKDCTQLTTDNIQADKVNLKTEIDSEIDNEKVTHLSANIHAADNKINLTSDATDLSNASTSTEAENSKEVQMPHRSKRCTRINRKCNDFMISNIKSLRSFTPTIIMPNKNDYPNEVVEQMLYNSDRNDALEASNDVEYDEPSPGSTTKIGNDYKAELYRYKLAVEKKRLALLDLQFEQTRSQMKYERSLYDMDAKVKRLKLEQMHEQE